MESSASRMTRLRRLPIAFSIPTLSTYVSGIPFGLLTVFAITIPLLAGCACSDGSRTSAHDPALAGQPSASSDANEPGMADLDSLDKEFTQKPVHVPDPLEGWNRMVFQFNDTLYVWVLTPVSKAYQRVTSEPVRAGVRNFFHNVLTPVRFVNCVAQGKGEGAANELGRFVVNTTWGVLGVADPAKERLHTQPPDDEDMGQTLAKYGAGHGFYIVWPILGPSTLRDSVGLLGDQFLSPLSYARPWALYVGTYAVKFTSDTSQAMEKYDSLKSAAVEPYSAIRDAYIQYRAKCVEQ
jgi:phospholipid-binding lipoprotein MlaA